jgi:Anti-sigma-K factor rskA
MPPRDPDERELDAVRATDGPDDLDVLQRVGEAARSVTDEDAELEEPSPGLWDRIAAAAAHAPAPPTAGAVPPVGPAELRGPDVPGVASVGAASRRSPVPAWVLAAAAAVIVVVVGAVAFAGSGDDETVVAAARLEPLAPAEPATAELVDADGRLRLDLPLATDDLPATEGFYEVWLIDTQVERLISLGPVRPDATYVVPADIDYRDFPIVDVSVEPPDGDPTHSGDSILRGTLS